MRVHFLFSSAHDWHRARARISNGGSLTRHVSLITVALSVAGKDLRPSVVNVLRLGLVSPDSSLEPRAARKLVLGRCG